jgi:synaptosomal-associated protein 29
LQQSNGGSRSFYSTPEGLERDDLEDEIDGNLGQISSGLSRLKMMGLAMNEEMDSQQDQLKR